MGSGAVTVGEHSYSPLVRTIIQGIRGLRRRPAAGFPLIAEGIVGACLVWFDILPTKPVSVPATAAFPFDVYFDVKQSLSYGESWAWVFAAVAVGALVRGGILAATLWLADGRPGPFAIAWARASGLAFVAAIVLLPSAGLFFTAIAIRYAPFVWLAAAIGFLPAALLARRAARLDVGGGQPAGKGVPELPGLLAYAYMLTLAGAGVAFLADTSEILTGLLIACLGPINALFVVGWRTHVKEETFPGGGVVAVGATALVVLLLAVTAGYDRIIHDPPPVGDTTDTGTLALLGGVDTTTTSGAVSEIDPRDLGFDRDSSEILSYRGAGLPYDKEDSRGDLDRVAERVASQLEDLEDPVYLLGHSQAALVLDRLIEQGVSLPEAAAMLAPPPQTPPPVNVPPPDRDGEGRPGGDFARGLSWLMDKAGLEPFDIDAEAAPVHLRRVVTPEVEPRRVAVWALGDSVWLYGDWRRRGEINVIALSDHVGVTTNARAYDAAQRMFEGKQVRGDESSWKSGLVTVLRYAFEPWRPG